MKKPAAAKTAPKKAPVKKAPAKKAPASKTATPKTAPVKKPPVKKAPVKKAPVKKEPVKKAVARKIAVPKKAEAPKSSPLLDLILATLDNDKAVEVKVIDIGARSSIADFMVVASGTSSRHVVSMAQDLLEKTKALGIRARDEGMPQGDWVVIDAGDVVAHLFRPEVRAFYDLEGMWKAPADKSKAKRKA